MSGVYILCARCAKALEIARDGLGPLQLSRLLDCHYLNQDLQRQEDKKRKRGGRASTAALARLADLAGDSESAKMISKAVGRFADDE